MTNKDNKKWIVLCLVIVAILAVILAAVLTKSCNSNNKSIDESNQTEAVFETEQKIQDINSEEERTYSEGEENTYSEEGHTYSKEESVSQVTVESGETIDNVTDGWDNVIEDDLTSREEEDTIQPQETTVQRESSSVSTGEIETVQAETMTQYDGIVLPDDVF